MSKDMAPSGTSTPVDHDGMSWPSKYSLFFLESEKNI
jgi:hypothetical protein